MFIKEVIIYIAVLVPIVVCWTIDLPEIRRHLFDKNEKRGFDNFGVQGEFFYDNIDGNSKHHSEEDHMKYANGFGYHSDVEQKVANIAKDGGRYLEGLRRSIESYIGILTNCTRMNSTLSFNVTSNTTWLPQLEIPEDIVPDGRPASCEEVTRAGEHVRRLAELAMWATRRLQDIAYAELYQQDVSEEEDELIFKLASFLDKLARLTGFRPNPKKFLEDPPVSTTTQSPIVNILADPVGAPEAVKNALIKCLKQESPEPATVRCAYPLPIPPAIAAIFNLNTTSPSPINEPQTPATEQPQSSELLVGSESLSFVSSEANPLPKSVSFDPIETAPRFSTSLQGIQKRSFNTPHSLPYKKVIKKRSIESPTINLMKYYVKHHVWTNSNPGKNDLNSLKSDNFDIKNDLRSKTVQKRSLFHRKTPNFHVPEHTLKQMKERIKVTIGSHIFKNREQMLKLKNTLDSIRSITYKKSVTKANIHKRSIHYENMFLPRTPDDPTQDISYYIKNKPGTNISPNLLQAAQVRLGLERIFQTGNIEVVRRYGANYNPLVPQPFYAGVLKTIADS